MKINEIIERFESKKQMEEIREEIQFILMALDKNVYKERKKHD